MNNESTYRIIELTNESEFDFIDTWYELSKNTKETHDPRMKNNQDDIKVDVTTNDLENENDSYPRMNNNNTYIVIYSTVISVCIGAVIGYFYLS
jgi:hypothetical protein